MEIMTTTAVYHNKEMDLSGGGNSSFREDNAEDEYNVYRPMITTFPISLKIVSLVMYSLVFVLGTLGNGVVIWVTGFKMKKTVNTVWYLNLAVADFIVTAFLPLRITYIVLNHHWPFGKFMCKMSFTVFYLNMFASIYTLVVISVDRCVCVVCPGWAQNHRSVRKASWVSLGVWVQALAFSSPIFYFRDILTSDYDKDVIKCYYSFVSTGNYSAVEVNQLWAYRAGVLIIVYVLMGFFVPFTVIVSCYSVIIYRLRNNRLLARQSSPSFKIIAAVIIAFFLCWAPFNIMYLIQLVDFLATESSEILNHVTTIRFPITVGLALLNSCLNPLLYVFMGQDYKDVFRSVLKVLEKAFNEELPWNNTSTNPGSSIYETALSQIKVSTELLDTTTSLLPPHAPTSTPTTSNLFMDLPQSLPGERLLAVRIHFIRGISQASLKCLLDELLVKKVLNESEQEEANGVQLRGDTARFVMDAVMKKGPAASSIMIKILCEIDPFFSEHLGLKEVVP